MKVSVVVCTYSMDRYEDFVEAVESVLHQSYEPVEVILISDGNRTVYGRMQEDFGHLDRVIIHCNDENLGLSGSRNRALEFATGDVVALIDDDAVADEQWIAELVSVYDSTNAIAVGGRSVADWVAGKPAFLPDEFFWLVGVTHRGFAEPGEEVRNTFGTNISFRREILEDLGGFETSVGRKGEKNLQAHETEFCSRMRQEYNRGVIYHPDAEVKHKVFEYRTDPVWLGKRAFLQGYSKRGLEVLLPEASTEEESEFLQELILAHAPRRLRLLVKRPTMENVQQFVALWVLTALVGFGYLYGFVKWR